MTDASLSPLARLRAVVAALRAPGTGCPWDLQQTAQTMAPYLLEETHEVMAAIAAGDARATCEELGDVLVNVFLIARMAEEAGDYSIDDVAAGVADKLVRRHPHVFARGDAPAALPKDASQVLHAWEAIKRNEADTAGGRRGALAGVPDTLPALLAALRIGEKAARAGFDWPDRAGPAAKLREELAEFDAACAGGVRADIEAELGDVLFSLVNVARHLGVNPELALRATITRFVRRFASVERTLGDRMPHASLAEMEAAWQTAKAAEARSP